MKDRFDLRVKAYDLQVGRLCCLIVWLFLAVVISPVALAQSKNDTLPVTTRDDRATIRVRYPEAAHLRDLQTDHDYQYGNDAPPPENPIARFFQWLFRKFGEFLRSESYYNVWQYVILAGVVALVIYLLMKAEVMKILFPKSAQSSGLDYENLAENIHEINFDAAVEEAVNGRNFRLATRLLYLQTLKRLTDAGRITYKPDKTNRQYVYELTNSPLQADFETLTRQFEFVWYGDFPIDESRFGQLRQQFRQFNQPVDHQA
ncbi:DUF4129 domain-containing protein [Spirosoma litoris]